MRNVSNMNSTNRDSESKAKVDNINVAPGNSQNNREKEDQNAGLSFGGRRSAKKVRISANTTVRRQPSRIHTKYQDTQPSYPKRMYARSELDTQADTIVAGMNCTTLYYTDGKWNVSPYTDRCASIKGVLIVSVATGCKAKDGREYIFIYNQALWMPELDHLLINPNQSRHFGINVQDDPHMDVPITITDHDRQFMICLKLSGTAIYIEMRKPTHEDLKSYPHMIFISDQLWKPTLISFPKKDESEVDEIEKRNISCVQVSEDREYLLNNHGYIPTNITHKLNRFMTPNYLTISSVKTDLNVLEENKMRGRKIFISGERHSNITPEDLQFNGCQTSVN